MSSSFDSSAYCSFKVSNKSADENEVLPLIKIIEKYQQQCRDSYQKDHIYLKDFLGYYFSYRDDNYGTSSDIYLKFSIDTEHAVVISEQDLEDKDSKSRADMAGYVFMGFIILLIIGFICFAVRDSRR